MKHIGQSTRASAGSIWRRWDPHVHIAIAGPAAEAVEDRLRELYPQAMEHYDDAVRAGAARLDAMRSAVQYLPPTMRRPGDGGLTSSVRGGPIGVNRIDLPATQIVLIGRNLRESDTCRLREAVEAHRPATAINNLGRLHAGTAAIVIRPRPSHAQDAMTAVRLARQDQAATVDSVLVRGSRLPTPVAARVGQSYPQRSGARQGPADHGRVSCCGSRSVGAKRALMPM